MARPHRYTRTRARALRGALAGLFLALAAAAGAAVKWDPIDPADLAAKDSTLSPGADAEVIFVRQELEEKSWFEAETEVYLRAKVYTQKGVETYGRFEIPSFGTSKVSNVAGRVIKPDGTIHELKKDDIQQSTVRKTRTLKLKVTRAALPNLEAGDVVEYRWRVAGQSTYFARWTYVQGTVPTREFSYRMTNIAESFVGWPNCVNVKEDRRAANMTVTARDLPAFEDEEYMPPDREFRGWLFMVRTLGEKKHDRMWQDLSEWAGTEFGKETSPSGSLKEVAAAVIGDAATDDEKLRRLYEFCQSEITNFSWVDKPEMQAIREKSRTTDDQEARQTLARKYGWSREINVLFAGLARAAGYDARLALNAGTDDLLNVRTPRGWAFMDREHVAVKLGDVWRIFDPGSYFVPYGLVSWRDEGATALICDKQGREIIHGEAPRSAAGVSRAQSKGKFDLSADGTLEGEVEMTWTGHLAIERKAESWRDSQDDVDKDFREELNKLLPDAEITGLSWENLRSRALPLVARFQVRVPGYAEAVGSRLLVRPAFFSMGEPVVFAAATRKYPIAFPFAWQEAEEVAIRLPEGYELEKPSAPLNVGTADSEFWAKYSIKYGAKSRTLFHSREFSLGGGGVTMFQAQSYPVLKRLFEELHRSDTHAIIVRPKPAAEAAPAAPAATTTTP
ncbi:MAG: DUF3857 and transglutaminase domain-containing protein [Opitutaceae bacterium]|nr:DUF3857 and transglutaminase domain-containing protein [Opitutaceae bacterium]